MKPYITFSTTLLQSLFNKYTERAKQYQSEGFPEKAETYSVLAEGIQAELASR
jgi:hypothetical protein